MIGRRQWSEALKRRIVAETLIPASSVSIVARRHDVNTNQIFKLAAEIFVTILTGFGLGQLLHYGRELNAMEGFSGPLSRRRSVGSRAR